MSVCLSVCLSVCVFMCSDDNDAKCSKLLRARLSGSLVMVHHIIDLFRFVSMLHTHIRFSAAAPNL